MTLKGTLHLVVGPVGAGKSTFSSGLMNRHRALFLDLDEWMVRLYGQDVRPSENVLAWYFERRERVRELLWDTTIAVLSSGTDVILELGLVTRAERETYYAKTRDDDIVTTVYLLDAPRDVRRERVARRNASGGKYVQIVPLEMFERASDAWEPPDEMERMSSSIVDV